MAVGMALRLLLTGHIEALSSCRENPVGHKLMFASMAMAGPLRRANG